ncbi:MAG: TIR domain-containing protein [Methylococcales bacterium]|nr:TIR domain-containing protein [Methylococcales bacterium]
MNNSNTEPEAFDVFLCHNSEDKPEIRRIADDLIKQGIKPWLDERAIRPGTSWQEALEEQIDSIGSATIFVGESGFGPWQNLEMRAFINEFVERKCPVIPAILPSAKTTPPLPILLKSLHYVDFRIPNPDPLIQLKWGITGKKPKVQTMLDVGTSEAAAILPEKEKQRIEIRLPGNFDIFSSNDKEKLLSAISTLLQIDGEIKITASRAGSVRVFLELTPEDADKIYAAAKSGQLDSLGITEARLYPSLADPPAKEQRSQLLILLNRVKEFWIDGVLKQSLHHEVLISLGKRAMDEAVEPPWNRTIDLPKQRQQLSLSDTRIETVFDATGLLLILGEPGSGKTTTLLELASTLIARAETDAKERIPVVLNLSSWKKQQTLAEWMADKLSNIYSVPKKLALGWLDKGYFIPLLDGLDEVKTEHQADCVEAINAYITQAEPPGLVVCCRLMEYQWLPEHLKLNGAICIEPLNREQIDQYFAAIGPEFESLRRAIQEDTVLQELTQSPLMLNIMSMAYQSATVENFTEGVHSLETHRTQIFDAYVDKMFLRKASLGTVFPKEKVVFWLGWLARKMTEHSQSVFFIENLQPSWLDRWRQKFAYRAISSLIFGLIVGLIFVLINGLGEGLTFGLISALVIGLSVRSNSSIKNGIICGLIFGLIFGLKDLLIFGLIGGLKDSLIFGLIVGLITALITGIGIGTLNSIKTVETLSWSWKSFFGKSLRPLIISGPIGMIIGLMIGVVKDLLHPGLNFAMRSGLIWLIVGLTGGIFYWLIGGFIAVFTDKIREDKALPNQGITLTIKNGILVMIIPVLIFGLILGLTGNLKSGLIFALIVGLIGGLNRGLGAVIKHYALRLALWLSGKTPFRFIPFLDYCAKLILLKKVGGGYIFIHRMLLEYFAKLGDQRDQRH